MSSSNCCFLTYIQISQEAGKVFWYSHLLKSFPQFAVIYTVKCFEIINKAEVDVFLEFSCFFYDRTDVGNWSLVPLPFFKIQLEHLEVSIHMLLKPGLEYFEHYFASVWDECNYAVVWTFFGIVLLWDWNENWPFPDLCHCWVFQICWHIDCSTFMASSFRTWNSSSGIHHLH